MSLGYNTCRRVYDLREMGCTWREIVQLTGLPAHYVPLAYAQYSEHVALNRSQPRIRT